MHRSRYNRHDPDPHQHIKTMGIVQLTPIDPVPIGNTFVEDRGEQ